MWIWFCVQEEQIEQKYDKNIPTANFTASAVLRGKMLQRNGTSFPGSGHLPYPILVMCKYELLVDHGLSNTNEYQGLPPNTMMWFHAYKTIQ